MNAEELKAKYADRFRTKTYHTIGYSDLEQIICDVYDVAEFSIPASEECSNDSDLDLGHLTGHGKDVRMIEYSDAHKRAGSDPSSFPFDANKHNRAKFEAWIKSKDEVLMYRTGLIVDDLIMRNILPQGNWLVSVCW